MIHKCYKCDSDLKLNPISVMLVSKYINCQKCKTKMIFDVPNLFIKYFLIGLNVIPFLLFIVGALISSFVIIGLGVLSLFLDLYIQFLNSKVLPLEKGHFSKIQKIKLIIWIGVLLVFIYFISGEVKRVRKEIFKKAPVIAKLQS